MSILFPSIVHQRKKQKFQSELFKALMPAFNRIMAKGNANQMQMDSTMFSTYFNDSDAAIEEALRRQQMEDQYDIDHEALKLRIFNLEQRIKASKASLQKRQQRNMFGYRNNSIPDARVEMSMHDTNFTHTDMYRRPLDLSATQRLMQETMATKLAVKSEIESSNSNKLVFETMNHTVGIMQNQIVQNSGQSP